MPVKAVPVEATEEAGDPSETASEKPVILETKAEDATEKPAAQPKRRSRASAKRAASGEAAPEPPAEPPEPARALEATEAKLRGAKAAVKAQAAADKAAEKAKKEQQAVDMKARVKCPICHRTVSQHCLLYTHVCPQAALNKKPKMPPLGGAPALAPLPEEPSASEARPSRAKASGPSRPRYSGDSDEPPRRWEEEFDEAPPPPPLVRQPVYQPSYREQLMLRQRERQHHQALAHFAPIRKLFKR